MTRPIRDAPRLPPESELSWSFVRGGGPGGQNVNKVASKAVLRWNVRASAWLRPDVRARFLAQFGNRVTAEGDLVLSSDRFRDQPRNVEDCRARLAAMVAEVAAPPRARRATKPTRASRERRLTEKRAHSQRKRDRRSGAGDD